MIGDILQPTHLLFVLVVALIVLGPKRLPEAGKSLGKGLRDFRSALSGEEQDRNRPNEVVTPAPAPVEPSQPIGQGVPEPDEHGAREPAEPAGQR